MKHLSIVLTSAEKLQGRPVAALFATTGHLIVAFDREQIDTALIPLIQEQARERLGHLRRLETPSARPALAYHLTTSEPRTPPTLNVTDTDICQSWPQDSCTPELVRYAVSLGNHILCHFVTPATHSVSTVSLRARI